MHIRQADSARVINSVELQHANSTITDTKNHFLSKLLSTKNSPYTSEVKSDHTNRIKVNDWSFKSVFQKFIFARKEKDKELERILFEGKSLQHMAGITRDSIKEKHMVYPPAFSLKNKKLVAGALLLNYTLPNNTQSANSMLSIANDNKEYNHRFPGNASYWYDKQLVNSGRLNKDTYTVDPVTKKSISRGHKLKKKKPLLRFSQINEIDKSIVMFLMKITFQNAIIQSSQKENLFLLLLNIFSMDQWIVLAMRMQ
ncbi:hypothetical protein [Candidatus Symbiopectobacterium sp. PLON1]|uniref:hypothetical protein n=1 Tax=Candidatus Symbiopectobacterium sp. PLON1 TaxID=2794575 RepID=UPI001A25F08F|nr:hypothetical protein [Candidatus Symbiopectobacterium sp. PLON1]MBG6248937.1 hypothetical protein [Candidatus Symbiopectobacterium sp. PLON1]